MSIELYFVFQKLQKFQKIRVKKNLMSKRVISNGALLLDDGQRVSGFDRIDFPDSANVGVGCRHKNSDVSSSSQYIQITHWVIKRQYFKYNQCRLMWSCDNVLNGLISSNLTRLINPKSLFYTQCPYLIHLRIVIIWLSVWLCPKFII